MSLLGWLFVVPALAVTPIAPTPPSAPRSAAPTFCAEWISQSHEGFERFTVFTDSTLVWKKVRSGADEIRRKKLEPGGVRIVTVRGLGYSLEKAEARQAQ